MKIILIAIILVVMYFFIDLKLKKKPSQRKHKNNVVLNYYPYAKGHLLTKTEHAFFIILVREALKRRLLVCPKVRLEDIMYVTDKQNRNKYRGYIKSRHVDFVLLNTKCETVAAIELDGPSHNTAKAAKADQFKNELFYTVKIPLIRICTGTDYIKEINYAFDTLQFPKADLQKNPSASQNS